MAYRRRSVEERAAKPPCGICVLHCEAYSDSGNPDRAYPCSPGMRLWARAHRDDPGDALGYVREVGT